MGKLVYSEASALSGLNCRSSPNNPPRFGRLKLRDIKSSG